MVATWYAAFGKDIDKLLCDIRTIAIIHVPDHPWQCVTDLFEW